MQISQDAEQSLLGELAVSLSSLFLSHYDFRMTNLSILQFSPVIEFWQKLMPVLYCTHAELGNQCMLHLREAQKASQSYCVLVCVSLLSSAAESRGGVKRFVNKSLFRFHYCEQPNQANLTQPSENFSPLWKYFSSCTGYVSQLNLYAMQAELSSAAFEE